VIVDLFAGAGGWDCGIRDVLGHTGLVIGLEWDRWACATRAAAGLPTIRCDIDTYPPDQFAGHVDGLIASPPCQDFSVAGNGAGRDGERGRLVDVPLRWVEATRPRWIACEQVPPVLPIWQEHAHRYRQLGYSAWTGVLNAADHGVPQTRKRAILIARLDGPALPPEPTHARNPEGVDLFGTSLLPWVSMAEALGWVPGRVVNTRGDRKTPGGNEFSADRPSWALTEKTRSWILDRRQTGAPPVDVGVEPCPTIVDTALGKGVWTLTGHPGAWALDRPATTVAADPRLSPPCHHDNGTQGKDAVSAADVRAWALDRPATTVVGTFGADTISPPGYRGPGDGPRQSQPGAIKITVEDAATLQSFPADWPWQGPKTAKFLQVGNAIPPVLAAAILAPMIGGAP
jgi:DNA (cytosine-5)-methyltransferase 1